jgi:enamine deaminase RidA (YjgF/YER057c/UK114 family)
MIPDNVALNGQVTLRCFESRHSHWEKAYVTAQPAQGQQLDFESLFSDLYRFLCRRGILLLQEKIFGRCTHREEIAAARNQAYGKFWPGEVAAPFTFIEGAGCDGGPLAGIQILGLTPGRPPQPEVTTIVDQGEPVGRMAQDSQFQECFLAGLSGLEQDHGGALAPDDDPQLAPQVRRTFVRCRDLLAAQGLTMHDVVRTWIYLPRLLDWYGEFNRARTSCFKDFGLVTEDHSYLPASTGIQARRRPGEEIFMDVLAFRSNTPGAVKVMTNQRQSEASDYGSLFARGMEVTVEGRPTWYVSGTASVDEAGKTIHFDDPQGQIVEVLLCIGSLLEARGGTLDDIVQATAYCKTPEVYRTFRRVTRLLRLDHLPFVPVYADVCRDELLFEIEAIAEGQTESDRAG